MKNIFYLLVLLILPAIIWGQKSVTGAGTASNLLLRFASSARVSGISEAYTGLANDENAILYNPAGLPNISNNVFSLNHSEWFEDIRIDNIIYGQKLTYNTAIGFSVTHMWMPSIQGKDQYGQATESFNVSSSIVQIGVGYKIQRAIYLGLTAKYFHEQLANYNASGLAFDFGAFMQTAIKNLTLGFSVQNLGGKVKYDKLGQNLPLTFRGGLAYRVWDKQLTFSTDVVKSTDTDVNLHLGVEYNFQQAFFLRLGNQFSNVQSLYPSYGVGFVIKNSVETNYTFGNLENLGSTHKVGFTYHFNKPKNNYSTRKSSYSNIGNSSERQNRVSINKVDDGLLLSWQSIEHAKYNIYVKAGYEKDWKKINTDPHKSSFKKVKAPGKNGTYYFMVTYILNNQEYPISKEVIFNVK